MTTMTIDPVLEALEAELIIPPIHHINVCRACEEGLVIGTIVRCRCGHVKAVEDFLFSTEWVSCQDCRDAQPVCGICGKRGGY